MYAQNFILTYPLLREVPGGRLSTSPALEVQRADGQRMVLVQGMVCQAAVSSWRRVLVQGMVCQAAVSSWKRVLVQGMVCQVAVSSWRGVLLLGLGQDRVPAHWMEAQQQQIHLSFGFYVCPNPEGLDGSLVLGTLDQTSLRCLCQRGGVQGTCLAQSLS